MKKVVTEVYSRVSGYYRPVSQWNKGKQSEFRERAKLKNPMEVYDDDVDKKQPVLLNSDSGRIRILALCNFV